MAFGAGDMALLVARETGFCRELLRKLLHTENLSEAGKEVVRDGIRIHNESAADFDDVYPVFADYVSTGTVLDYAVTARRQQDLAVERAAAAGVGRVLENAETQRRRRRREEISRDNLRMLSAADTHAMDHEERNQRRRL